MLMFWHEWYYNFSDRQRINRKQNLIDQIKQCIGVIIIIIIIIMSIVYKTSKVININCLN
jgi:t-SNARE complex subunit (syntaxin)